MKLLERARKVEEIVKLLTKNLAGMQEAMATSYMRQAGKPIYSGQEAVCEEKANPVLEAELKEEEVL